MRFMRFLLTVLLGCFSGCYCESPGTLPGDGGQACEYEARERNGGTCGPEYALYAGDMCSLVPEAKELQPGLIEVHGANGCFSQYDVTR